jgi:hypothetical protein
MPAVPFRKTGTAPEETPWSWDADAQNKVLGDDGENWTRYKQAHAWWDGSTGEDAQKKAAYKLPHHRMGESGLEAVWRGVSSAMGRLSQTDLPEEDVSAVFDHLAGHYAQWDKEPPEKERFLRDWRAWRARKVVAMTTRTRTRMPMIATRAQIVVTTPRLQGQPTPDELGLINQMARSPLSAEQVYVVPAEISNQSIDAYYTRMTPKSLAAYAEDANRGVAFCDSHEHMKLPIGRSFYGVAVESERDDGGQMLTTQALAYMIRGMRLSSGLSSDDTILGMEAGIYADVSIGFIPDHFWCNICGLDMLASWECMHWPGVEYEIKREGAAEPEMVVCVADVDARLAEFSLVYDGATPNAMLLKAEREMEAGRASPRLVRFVEETCRVNLTKRWGGVTTPESPTPGLWTPPGVGVSSPKITISSGTTAQAGATPEGEDTMRGSEMIRAFLETRAGKALSSANEQALRDLMATLEGGHDTMREGIDGLASFLERVTAAAEAEDEEADDEGDEAPDSGEESAAGKHPNNPGEENEDPSVDEDYAGPAVSRTAVAAERATFAVAERAKKSDNASEDDEDAADAEDDEGDEGDGADEVDPEDMEEGDDGDEEDEDEIEGDDSDEADSGKSGKSGKKRARSAPLAARAATRPPHARPHAPRPSRPSSLP